MLRKPVSSVLLLLLAMSALALALKIRPVKADEATIYINADGSVSPLTALISTFDNVTYTFAGNINESIVVRRNNILIDGAGCTVQGSGTGTGIDLESVNNVTIENTSITNFSSGIWLDASSNNTLSGNTAIRNYEGIVLDSSSNNTLRDNEVTENPAYGIALYSSSYNTFKGNTALGNAGLGGTGIYLSSSSNNTLSGNNATANYDGIVLDSSAGSVLFQNVIDSSIRSNFGVYGSALNDYINRIDASNLADGKPVYYIVNQNGLLIDPATHPSIGYLALVNCTSITVENSTFANINRESLLLAYTTNSTIARNNIVNNRYGVYLYSSSNNTLSGNNVTGATQYTYKGIVLDSSSNNMVSRNNVTGNGGGIELDSSFGNTVSGNKVAENPGGIGLISSSNNTLSGNNVTGSTSWGISLFGSSGNMVSDNTVTQNNFQGINLGSSFNDTVSGNNVIGNYGDGIYVQFYCFNETVSGNNASGNNADAIGVNSCSNITVTGNNVTGNGKGGIALYSSSGNTVSGNNAVGNGRGIFLDNSSNNTIYHNNFANNTQQTAISSSRPNVWDNGYPSGGNYWSSYTGSDSHSSPYQNETGSDGIGDTSYVLDANNTDHYPLIAPITSFGAGNWNGTVYDVDVVSNSTVSNVQVDIANKTVSFNVTGPESTYGFCRLTVPNIIVQDLWHGNYTILIDNEKWHFTNWTDTTNTYVYVNYTHSEHKVVIIPEFPSTVTVWLLTALSTLAVALAKRRTLRKRLDFHNGFACDPE